MASSVTKLENENILENNNFNLSKKMKKNQKEQLKENEHGIISVVQSPEPRENKSDNENETDNLKKHGVISIEQSQDEKTSKKLDK